MTYKLYPLILLFVFIPFVTTGMNARASGPETTDTIPNSANSVCPVLVGESIPEIVLKTPKNKPFSLNKAIHEKPAVLIFYRGGW